MTELYKHVPKDFRKNLEYRVAIGRRAEKDAGFRRALMVLSKNDVLWWLNAMGWVYEPRTRYSTQGKRLPKFLPFITWQHQDPVILKLKENLGQIDIGIEKSRGEGMSWIGVFMALHDWLFTPGSKIGIVADTEKKSDDPGNLDSLGGKLDFAISKLPRWMVGVKDKDWKRNAADHSWVNFPNLSQINAFAAAAGTGRGGRYSWFHADELAFWEPGNASRFMASIGGATESRLVISTPNGARGEYYQFMHTPSTRRIKLVLDWKDNQTRNRGLYRMQDGVPVAVDPVNNPLPKSYNPPSTATLDLLSSLRRKGFDLEKGTRSPWYDNECDRADMNPRRVAQEYDRDYGGSKEGVFGNDFFDRARLKTSPPKHEGTLDYDLEDLNAEFDQKKNGQLKLWVGLNVRNRPPIGQYVLGADIANGLGGAYTSNSVASVFNTVTMEQVAELATTTMPPHDFAEFCIALAKWFYDAYLIWEHNGPGAGFTNRVIDRKYGNVHERTIKFRRSKKRSKALGWMTNKENKPAMFSDFYRAVKTGELVVRSEALVEECDQYQLVNGKIIHEATHDTDEESGKGEQHGDRVIAACLALQGMGERPATQAEVENTALDNPPMGTLAWREKMFRDEAEREKDDWDDRTCEQLAGGNKW